MSKCLLNFIAHVLSSTVNIRSYYFYVVLLTISIKKSVFELYTEKLQFRKIVPLGENGNFNRKNTSLAKPKVSADSVQCEGSVFSSNMFILMDKARYDRLLFKNLKLKGLHIKE